MNKKFIAVLAAVSIIATVTPASACPYGGCYYYHDDTGAAIGLGMMDWH